MHALALQADGKVLVGHNASSYNGSPISTLVRLNSDGSSNNAPTPVAGATFVFNPGNTSGSTRTVSTSGSYTATDPASGCSAVSNAVVVNATPADLVVSTTGQTVTNQTYHNVTINSGGVLTATGLVITGTLTINSGGTLREACSPITGSGGFVLAAGGMLIICDPQGLSATPGQGAVQTTGTRTLSPAADYLYDGTVAQATGTGLPATVGGLTVNNPAGLTLLQNVDVSNQVTLTSGDLHLDGHTLTLLSGPNGTALVANTGGSVLGNISVMQRNIGTNTGAGGYRHYSSPMAGGPGGQTVNTLATAGYAPNFAGAAAYNASPTPALVTPFPTVFLYNQDRIATTVSNLSVFD